MGPPSCACLFAFASATSGGVASGLVVLISGWLGGGDGGSPFLRLLVCVLVVLISGWFGGGDGGPPFLRLLVCVCVGRVGGVLFLS